MCSLHREDYLLRQTRAIGAVIARLAGLRATGQLDEARIELDEAYAQLLGSRTELLRRIDVATVALLLDSADALLALAHLTAAEAAQSIDPDASAPLHLRAVQLALAAHQLSGPSGAIRDFLADLAPRIDAVQLSASQQQALRGILDEPPANES